MLRTSGWAPPILGQPSDWHFECSNDVKWRIHHCHVFKKSKLFDLDELRQLGRWLRDQCMECGRYGTNTYCQRHPPCPVRLVLGLMSQSHIIRLVGYRYNIVGLWWVERYWNARILYSRGWNSFWPGQSDDDALLVLSYQYCEFNSHGRWMIPQHPIVLN